MELVFKRNLCSLNIPLELLLLADPDVSSISNYLEHSVSFVAEYSGEIVAAIVLCQDDDNSFEIKNISVREDFQKKGIGTKLLQIGIKEAKESIKTILRIKTGNSSLVQLEMYKKNGFKIVGIDYEYFTKNYNQTIFENGIECKDLILLEMTL